MKKRSDIKLFALVFAATSLALVCLLRFRVIEQVAHAMEKGRLRAIREVLLADDRVVELNWVNRRVAEVARPAVVSIESRLAVQVAFAEPDTQGGPPADEPARSATVENVDSGNLLLPQQEDGFGSTLSIQQGLGSGLIFDADRGYIVTNAHVVDGAQRVTVFLSDGRHGPAEVLGSAPEADLAVIHVDLPRLKELPFGDSDAVAVGDSVFAVGNPFGLQGTVSKGIISAVNRSHVSIGQSHYASLLQTDAYITPGSSGGPLVNLSGEVIGISTAMATETGRYDGVGFAIPSARVVELLGDLVAGGPGVLGVLVASASHGHVRTHVRALGWEKSYGALVTEVVADGAADRGGIEVDDIVFSLDGARIQSHRELAERVAGTEPATEVTLGLWHDRRRVSLSVRIGRKYAPRKPRQATMFE